MKHPVGDRPVVNRYSYDNSGTYTDTYSDQFASDQFPRELPLDSFCHELAMVRASKSMAVFKILVVAGVLVISILLGYIVASTLKDLPDVAILENYRPMESSKLFDRYGKLIANIQGDEDRAVVPLSEVSHFVKKAVLAIEDTRFYKHNGIDIRGTFRAFYTNLREDGNVQGGSTVTQQLVKNLFLTPEKSYKRKLIEAVLSLKVEKRYTKDRILELYLNQVYFGNQSYGIEKAARRYFKKPARDLTLSESALLAGLLKAPEGLSPYHYPQASKRRKEEVLLKMYELKYITKAQYDRAVKEPIVLNDRQAKYARYPYFVTYIIQELEEMYGRDVLRHGGLNVYTTLDPVLQEKAEKIVEGFIKSQSPYTHVKQGALVAMDLQTGHILSLVGGVNFKDNQFNSATQARRAVGSTFKPFVYLTGVRLEKITPKTPISDRPVSFTNPWGQGWSPKNWDGRYMGAMDIRKALTLSRNTPTVQIGVKVGVPEVIKTAQLAGIRSHIDNNYSSLLGSSGVSPLELVTGYATLARGGVYIKPSAIQQVEDNRGRIIKVDTPEPKRVFNQDHVAAIVDILIDVVEKGTGRNAQIKGRMVAGKTGTTDQVRDIWFMGFTPEVVAGVWFGDPANQPLNGVFSFNSAQIWHDYVVEYYKAYPAPPSRFFVASDAYAAKAGLVHLIDPLGVAEAKKALKNQKEEGLSTDSSFSGEPGAGRANSRPNQASTSPSGGGGQRPVNRPEVNRPEPNPPAQEENPQAKYDRWQKTLDELQDNLKDQ